MPIIGGEWADEKMCKYFAHALAFHMFSGEILRKTIYGRQQNFATEPWAHSHATWPKNMAQNGRIPGVRGQWQDLMQL